MKKKIFASFVPVFFFVLDVAALDDITTNNQSSYFWEITMLITSIVVIGSVGALMFRKKTT